MPRSKGLPPAQRARGGDVANIEVAHDTPRVRYRGSVLNLILFIVMVIVPSVGGGIYYGFIASDRYVSTAVMTVRSAEGMKTNLLGSFLGDMVASGSSNEAYIVQDYILSQEMMSKLEGWLNLREMFQSKHADYFSRLAKDASEEDMLDYYRNRVSVNYDSTTGNITLTTEAFLPEDAQAMAQAIIALSDELVENIAARARKDAMAFARSELERAEKQMREVRLKLADFRDRHGELDPTRSADALLAIVGGIETELSRSRTELATLRGVMRENTAQVDALKQRIAALQKQRAEERARLANEKKNGQSYTKLLAEYENLLLTAEFVKTTYASAVAAVESARSDAQRKHLYLVPFVAPTLPDEATEPQRLRIIGSIVLFSLMAFGIVTLILAAIREHARS